MRAPSYLVREVDGASLTITIPPGSPPTVKTIASEVAKIRRVGRDNVRLIVRGVVCDDRAQLSSVITSPDDFFVANISYPPQTLSGDAIPSELQRLMEMGAERSQAERALRDANGDLQRAANFLQFT